MDPRRTPEDSDTLEELFDRAAELPESEHAAFLERHCGQNEALRRELARLLAAHVGDDLLGRIGDRARSPIGARIGPYELLERVGEGGMGEVHRARQLEPVVREVALKLIRTGTDSGQLTGRFEAERQAQAMMDHPNIAKVLDAGSTDAGEPYLVMEFVDGVSIVEHCEDRALDVMARLRLFISVCRAIQHAHQKGIIHRDIKPSNVQVTVRDGEAVAKVIDFGIAKAVHGDPLTGARLTRHLQMIGTPAYMSPEQAGMTEVDIDTRSDIYSLGVLLYELLTGTTPLDASELSSANLGEVVRRICEETPHKPSTRVSTATGSSAEGEISGARRLAHDLRGDLDWIVMRCLEKDRSRRYESAGALADDLERHLRDEPVTAGPPSRSYRLRKFVRRNRLAVAAAAALLTVLVLGACGTTWGMLWALDEKARADDAAERASEAARAEAKARIEESDRAAELGQVAEFQASRFERVDPMAMGVGLRRAVLAEVSEDRRDELERALQGVNFTNLALGMLGEDFLQPSLLAIDEEFAGQPRVQARLLEAVSGSAYSLGLADLALEPQRRAVEIWASEFGADHWRARNAENGVGVMYFALGRYDEAEPYLHRAAEGLRDALGDHDPRTLNTLDGLADLLRAQARYPEAEALYRDVLASRREHLGEEHRDTLESARSLGALLREQGGLDEAERLLADALEVQRRRFGDEDLTTLATMNSLAVLLAQRGRAPEAEELYRKALDAYRSAVGDDHPRTVTAAANLSQSLAEQGKLAEAEPYVREGLERLRRTLGDEHRDTLRVLADLGALLARQGRFDDAEALLREALAGLRQTEDEPRIQSTINNLGFVLREQGRYAEAEPYVREVLAWQRAHHSGDDANKLVTIANMGALLRAQGKLAEAEPFCRESLEGIQRVFGDDHPVTLSAMNNLGMLLVSQEKPDQAEPLFRAAADGGRRLLGDDNDRALGSLGNLAGALLTLGRVEEAEPLVHKAVEASRRSLGEDHPVTLTSLNLLGDLRREQGRFEEAEAHYKKAERGLRRSRGDEHPNTLITIGSVGLALQLQDRPKDALPYLEEAFAGLRAALGEDHSATRKAAAAVEECRALIGPQDPADG